MFSQKFPSFKDSVSKLSVLNLFLLICFLSFFSIGSAWRPSPQPPAPKPITSTIKGYIKDKVTNRPISGAKISLESLFGQEKSSTFSDSGGYYELKDLTFSLFGSWYVLKVSKSGYKTDKETQSFSNGQSYKKNKSLMPNYPPEIISFIPSSRLICTTENDLYLSINAVDKDKDPLMYRYLIDERIIKNWSDSSSYSFRPMLSDRGRHKVKIEVKDDRGGENSVSVDIYIVKGFSNPPG